MRDQRTLGRACGAAGVDQHRGFFGLGDGCGEGAVIRQIHVEIALPPRATGRQHPPQHGALAAHGLDAGDAAFITDGNHRPAVMQTELKRLGSEQHGQWHGHRADLQHGHIGNGGFKTLRHDDGDPVAAPHTQALQRVAERIGGLLQRQIGVALGPGTGLVNTYRHLAGGARIPRPAAAADLGDVEVVIDLPAKAAVHCGVVVDLRFVAGLTAIAGVALYHWNLSVSNLGSRWVQSG